jgi:hypothetical protein
MRVKPKEIFVNLPVVLLFDTEDEIAQLASGFNTFLHGKSRLKYETLGMLNKQFVGMFYLQRNGEFSLLREEFMRMIEEEEYDYFIAIEDNEEENTPSPYLTVAQSPSKVYNPDYGDNRMCLCAHTYDRHFDSYDMDAVVPAGCKYCECALFEEKV